MKKSFPDFSTTGLILAGGRSRRFGADKARHPVRDQPMIEHVYAALAAVAGEVYVSVRALEEGDGFPATALPDRLPDAGPLGGLHAGLHAARTPWLLVVACDLPFITPEALERLLEARDKAVQAVVAENEQGRLQPLCACYRVSILPVVEARLQAGRRAMHGLLDQLETVGTVRLPDEVLRNINRPTDLDAGL